MVFSLAPEAEGIEAEYAALDRREVQNNIPRSRGYTACSVCHPQLVLLRTKSYIISTVLLNNQIIPLTFLVSVVVIKIINHHKILFVLLLQLTPALSVV